MTKTMITKFIIIFVIVIHIIYLGFQIFFERILKKSHDCLDVCKNSKFW